MPAAADRDTAPTAATTTTTPPPPKHAAPVAPAAVTATPARHPFLTHPGVAALRSSPPNPPDFESLYSLEGVARRLAGLREVVAAAASSPGIVGLHGGFPPATAFPFRRLSATLADGSELVIDDEDEVYAAQQYSVALLGHPPLAAWAATHVAAMHAPPAPPRHTTLITNGNNPTLDAALRTFLNRGDAVLCEEFTYPHVAESLVAPAGFRALPVAVDAHGIVPAALTAALAEEQAAGRPTPKIMYTVPVGQNPTGAVTPPGRRVAIYSICRTAGILIIEDDPYFYLQFGPEPDWERLDEAAVKAEAEWVRVNVSGGAAAPPQPPPLIDHAILTMPRGLTGLGPSYLSLDVDGRVIRLDSFSKTLLPGIRLGWATASPPVAAKLAYHLHGVLLGAPPMAQVMTTALLRHWGEGGLESHVRSVQVEYGRRAAIAASALATHCASLVDFTLPAAGMFIWARLRGCTCARGALAALTAARVCVVPGAYAHCSGDRDRPCPCVRLSFAGAADGELVEGAVRLGAALRGLEKTGVKQKRRH